MFISDPVRSFPPKNLLCQILQYLKFGLTIIDELHIRGCCATRGIFLGNSYVLNCLYPYQFVHLPGHGHHGHHEWTMTVAQMMI